MEVGAAVGLVTSVGVGVDVSVGGSTVEVAVGVAHLCVGVGATVCWAGGAATLAGAADIPPARRMMIVMRARDRPGASGKALFLGQKECIRM